MRRGSRAQSSASKGNNSKTLDVSRQNSTTDAGSDGNTSQAEWWWGNLEAGKDVDVRRLLNIASAILLLRTL